MHGVKSFDFNLPTDWSKLGIAFWLCQKTSSCTGHIMPGCCDTGWQTVLCGSRFCSPAESRYAPIEGEGLASTWGLEKCKFYLLGMKNFTLAIDHNPLVHVFGQQAIMDIPNMVTREPSSSTPLNRSFMRLTRLSCFSLVWGWPPLLRSMMKMTASD